MTVLVTGGLGFIGSRVVLQLLKKDIDVLVTDLDIEKNKDKFENNILKIGKDKNKVKFQKLDITDHKQIESIFQNIQSFYKFDKFDFTKAAIISPEKRVGIKKVTPKTSNSV